MPAQNSIFIRLFRLDTAKDIFLYGKCIFIMDNIDNLKWLEWAKELQFLAQAGLTYTNDDFDKERYVRIREIAAEIISMESEYLSLNKEDAFMPQKYTIPGTLALLHTFRGGTADSAPVCARRPRSNGFRD